MDNVDPAVEWRKLSERYHQMSDEELVALARQSSELTEIAQQALAHEVSSRRLSIAPPAKPAPSIPQADADSPYAEDRELVEICTVWSREDALRLQTVLDGAGIPFYVGSEMATGAEGVTSDFTKGLSVRVMRIGRPWANLALKSYFPVAEPKSETEEEVLEDLPVRCPKCHSPEVVFGEFIDGEPEDVQAEPQGSSSKFDWTCDACGYQWEDDGIVKDR
jgi:hypothetical protein